MNVKYDIQSQDIFLFLSQEELDGLEAKMKNTDFFGNCIKAGCKEAGSYFYLGCSKDKIFELARDEGGVQYISPKHLGDPYYINLKPIVLSILKQDSNHGIRLPGGPKLKFVVEGN